MASDHPHANLPKLSLHVPEPQFRPGDTVDFAAVDVPPAGEARRPDTADAAKGFTDLAYTLVRVLDDDGRAVGPWDPKLSPDMLRRMLRNMALLRAFDERMFRAQRQGKTSFYMKALGEEAVAIAAAAALEDDDMCFPSYRQQGLLIARGYPLVEMMNQIYSNSGDKLQGKQLPIMYSARDFGFFSISGNLDDAISAGGRLGDGVGGEGRHADRGDVVRRGIDRGGRFPFGLHLCQRLPRAGDHERRQQPMGDFELLGLRGRRGDDLRGARGRLWHRRAAGRRQRRAGGLCGDPMGGGAGADQPGADADRAFHLSRRGSFDLRRSGAVSLARASPMRGRWAIRSGG